MNLGAAFGQGMQAERDELPTRIGWSVEAWRDRVKWLEEQVTAGEVKRAAAAGPARDVAWLELERLRGRLMLAAIEGASR